MVRERAAGHGISLACDIEPEVGTVLADELKLKQVIVNLLSNAVKFTPDGGSVTVTARRVDDEVHVSVRDTGIGIAAAEQERIFEAFQRGGRAARTSTEGTGLGLTLSKRIVDLHGGRLWMESEPGVGSTFSFAIPLVPASAAPDDRPAESSEPVAVAGDGMGSVLVVEDDRRSADLLRVYLEDAGYAVSIARDGVEGLELARRLHPTAVILDISAAAAQRLGSARAAQGRSRDVGDPRRDRLDDSTSRAPGSRWARPSTSSSRSIARGCSARCRAACRSARARARWWRSTTTRWTLDLLEAVLAPEGWRVVRATGGEEGVRAGPAGAPRPSWCSTC